MDEASPSGIMDEASSLPEGITEEDVKMYQARWGMPKGTVGYQNTLDWLWSLAWSSVAMAFLVSYKIEGVDGSLLFASTAKSASVYDDNVEAYEKKLIISEPHWLHFEVYWYPRMLLQNFAYLKYAVPVKLDSLEAFMNEYAEPDWKRKYTVILNTGYFAESFRILVRHVCQPNNMLELICMRSYRIYRGLEILCSRSSPSEEARYLLNDSIAVCKRVSPAPEDWWKFSTLWSYGHEALCDCQCLAFCGECGRRVSTSIGWPV